MLYGTGAAYILGQALGGSYGLIRGWNNPQATTLKLKINSVLNTCTRTGPWMANHGGALGKPHHCF
jgi:import inner membrane translocase subunit TIM23